MKNIFALATRIFDSERGAMERLGGIPAATINATLGLFEELQKRGFGELSSDIGPPKELRDEFAMAAMQGLLSNEMYMREMGKPQIVMGVKRSVPSTPETAYEMADAMLKARGK